MNLCRTTGLLIAAWVSATAVLADVRGVSNPPVFTSEEMALIGRHPRLIGAAKSCPWQLRRALDIWDDLRRGAQPPDAPVEPVPCTQTPPDSGRASAEGPFDLLQILKEAAGQDKR